MEARPVAGMACRLVRVDHVQHGIRIAIDQYFTHRLDVAGFFALHPQLVARCAPEPGIASLDRVVQRLFVGVGQHEDVLGLSVLYNDWEQPIALFKVNILERLGIHASILHRWAEINLYYSSSTILLLCGEKQLSFEILVQYYDELSAALR